MNQEKIGSLIYKLRKEKGLTQLSLAEKINVSDKAVSKWERGRGCPDISILPTLAAVFGVNVENLLSGELLDNDKNGDNMNKIKFYVCPTCGNIVNSTGESEISCCGKKLTALEAKKSEDIHGLKFEEVEDQWYLTSDHPMTKDHYISFIAYVTGDKALICKQYPEWNIQCRMFKMGMGKVYFYCTNHGLYYVQMSSKGVV